jgi:SWI/SNF-related matrix-associated actin-dependent regulator of chromatin subfamily D
MVVELERDPTVYPDGNIVEVPSLRFSRSTFAHIAIQWPHTPGSHNPVLDGFTVRRMGDTLTRIRVVLYLDHFPEQFKIAPELGACPHAMPLSIPTVRPGDVLGIKEESRIGVMQALWNYIKIQGLQDKVDRRMIRADDPMRTVSSTFLLTTFSLNISFRSLAPTQYPFKNCLKS